MKRFLNVILVFILGSSILYGCAKESLPVPEYPLDADAIEEALEEWDVSLTIQEDAHVREIRPGQSMYGLSSAENSNFMVAGVSSGEKDGERALFISFPTFYSPNSIPAEACENIIVFATRLFGGFESTHQVYNRFIREYDKVNTEKIEYEVSVRSSIPMSEGASHWESNVNGTICQIRLVQPTLSEQQEYLSSIALISDWDTFYPDETVEDLSIE